MVIMPGQIVTGIADLGAQIGLSHQQTRTALDKLKLRNEITIEPHSLFSIITITKWVDYQAEQQAEQQTANKRVTTTKEREEYKERKNINPIVPFPEGVSEKTFSDFLAHRKAKKAMVTQTALDGIEREAKKAGMTLEAALLEIMNRGWTGFKADWMKPTTQNQQQQFSTRKEPMKRNAEQWKPNQ